MRDCVEEEAKKSEEEEEIQKDITHFCASKMECFFIFYEDTSDFYNSKEKQL